MKKGIVERIVDCIREIGEDVYLPSYHEGDCVKRYVVVKYDGAVDLLNVSSTRPTYTIMLYVPKDQYTTLQSFSFKVKQALKKLYPLIEPTGVESGTFYDENVKGHMISLEYLGIRKIKKMKGV